MINGVEFQNYYLWRIILSLIIIIFNYNYLSIITINMRALSAGIVIDRDEVTIDIIYTLVNLTTSVQHYPDWDVSRVQIAPDVQSAAYRCYYGLSLTNRNYIVMLLWLCQLCAVTVLFAQSGPQGYLAASLSKAVSLYALNRIRKDYSICDPSRPSCWPERPIVCNLVANIDRWYAAVATATSRLVSKTPRFNQSRVLTKSNPSGIR